MSPPALGAGNWRGWAAFIALAAALAFPIIVTGGKQTYLVGLGSDAILATVIMVAAALASLTQLSSGVGNFVIFAGTAIAATYVIVFLPSVANLAADAEPAKGRLFAAAIGFWALVVAAWALASLLVSRLAEVSTPRRGGAILLRVVIPLLFGAGVVFLWEVVVRGFAVPFIILPPPSAIWARIVAARPTLWIDFQQTFLHAVLIGYAIGCLSGFVVAIAVDRVPFLKRGLLPVGNLVSALPIVAVAPIMVMWFGFDWPSKAAVVVAMTFFPMLVNTVAGLAASEAIERDLMHTYGAGYWQSLFKLRLPAALPFIFNALKINSTLAMIGAIVAEFFGTPIKGMGFRISTEVGRMNTDMVWAEIAVAALAGSAFYGVVSLIERVATFWHPSFRQPLTEG
jgi:NitT/TauT family transport system permease protein